MKSIVEPQEKSLEVQVTLETSYLEAGPSNAKHQVLLVHGYNQSAQIFYDEIKPAIPDDWRVIVPNGLFLSPQKKRDGRGFKLGYAWYFYELGEKRYYTTPRPAYEYLKTLINEVGLKNATLLGYSQGAYVLPKLAAEVAGVQSLICLNGSYHSHIVPEKFNYYIYALNGDGDLIVDPCKARDTFNDWMRGSGRGQQEMIFETGHRINGQFVERLKEIFKEIEERPY